LADEDVEIRRAAALACGMKEDRSHVPDLIPLLDDPEPAVGRAAYVALKHLTGQDFGPPASATAAEKSAAIQKWKTWWSKASGSKGRQWQRYQCHKTGFNY